MFFCTGYQTQCSECHKPREDLGTLEREKVAEREANLRDANRKIEDLSKENKGLELKIAYFHSVMKKLNKEIKKLERKNKSKIETEECETNECHEVKAELNQLSSETERLREKHNSLKKEKADCLQKIKDLETKNNNLKSKIKTKECEIERLSTKLEQLRNENKSLKNKNAEFLRKIKDLERHSKALETENKNLSSKIKTKECETSECDEVKAELNRLSSETERVHEEYNSLKKENADCLQKIKDLETKNNNLESKIETKECEIEQLRRKHNESISKENADSLQKIADLEKKNNALERKNDTLRKKLESKDCKNCKMLDEEVNKYKNAVNRKY